MLGFPRLTIAEISSETKSESFSDCSLFIANSSKEMQSNKAELLKYIMKREKTGEFSALCWIVYFDITFISSIEIFRKEAVLLCTEKYTQRSYSAKDYNIKRTVYLSTEK